MVYRIWYNNENVLMGLDERALNFSGQTSECFELETWFPLWTVK